jgi:hypothetical protein
MEVTPEERRTLAIVRDCIEADRFAVSRHFMERMHERALFWPDVLAVIDDPDEVHSDAMDDYNRPKWRIIGAAAGIADIEIVCAIETVKNEAGEDEESETEFITLYWQD